MNNLLSYKNYNGTVEYSADDDCLFGKIIGVNSLISYEGNSLEELKKDFENAVDEYLGDCSERNANPERDFSGDELRTLLNNIPEVEPDEWDLQMLSEIESDPDCKEFVSEEELQKIL